jgi:spore coat protein U-like protein
MRRWLLLRLALAALAWVLSPPAFARRACSWSVQNVAFGTVDLLSGAVADVSSKVRIECEGPRGLSNWVARVCPNIGAGTGTATSSSRYMSNGPNLLGYQLYQDAGHTMVWGSHFWAFSDRPPTLDVPLDIEGEGSLTTRVYARLFGGQAKVPPLSYSSTLAGLDARLTWTFCPSAVCPPCGGPMAGFSDTSFTATAKIVPNCLVAATTLDFGSWGVLDANVDSTNTISITCTAGTPWTASLNGGSGIGGTVALRKMTGPGGAQIGYMIYRNAARTEIWGDGTSGTQIVSGAGNGLAQSQIGYGRVPPQATPAAATYSDTIVVTVVY